MQASNSVFVATLPSTCTYAHTHTQRTEDMAMHTLKPRMHAGEIYSLGNHSSIFLALETM